jgi:transposase
MKNDAESHRHPIEWVGRARGRFGTGEGETVIVSDPERASEQTNVRACRGFGRDSTKGCLGICGALSVPAQRGFGMDSLYAIAGVDVHKKMLAVVVADAADGGECLFERRKFGTGTRDLEELKDWLAAQHVQEVVMESTAQYWKPVWQALEGEYRLHLAQAHSNRAPKGRKRDYADAERLVKRHVAGELILSFVPDAEQRLWRTLSRSKQQLTRDRVRLQNELEAFLEEVRIKLSSHVSDLLGLSGVRMLQAIADGVSDPAQIADLAAPALRATKEQLTDALSAASRLGSLHRQILGLFLDRLRLLDTQIATLHQAAGIALHTHQESVQRLAEVPGLGVDSAQQIIAEVGPQAATFPSAGQMASWVGTCPGREESAAVSASDRSPKGNRPMRRILAQAAHAAVKSKGSVFEMLYKRWVPQLGHVKAIWAVAHRLCRLVWKILHEGVRYQERGYRPDPKVVRRRTNRLLRELRRLGYQAELKPIPAVPCA